MALTDERARLARLLYVIGAVKFGAFRLKMHETNPDAPLSPIYLNLRTADHPQKPGPLTSEVMRLIGDLFAEIAPHRATHFADIPEAGTPFGDQVMRVLGPQGYGRLTLHKAFRENKTRYITDQVDGEYAPGDTCVVVDDLITQADTKLEAIGALERAGLFVDDVMVVVDRQQGGQEQLEARGYRLRCIFKLRELLYFYVEERLIDLDTADKVWAYITANRIAVAT